MIIYKVPKPISIIGEYSTKCMTVSSCNFSYLSKFGNVKSFFIDKKTKDFYKRCFKNYSTFKSKLLNLVELDDFPSCYTSIFGKFNYINKTSTVWNNVEIDSSSDFFNNLLIFHIRRKYFKYNNVKPIENFNIGIIHKMVDDAYNAYVDNDFKFMGKLIDSYWRIKTQLDPNSTNDFIYKAYADCRLSGAWGGKMDENTMIILAPKEKHEDICSVMKDHIRLNSSVNTTGIVREELFSGNSNCCK